MAVRGVLALLWRPSNVTTRLVNNYLLSLKFIGFLIPVTQAKKIIKQINFIFKEETCVTDGKSGLNLITYRSSMNQRYKASDYSYQSPQRATYIFVSSMIISFCLESSTDSIYLFTSYLCYSREQPS